MIVDADQAGNLVITLDDGRVLVISNTHIKTIYSSTEIDSLFENCCLLEFNFLFNRNCLFDIFEFNLIFFKPFNLFIFLII